VNVKYSHSVKVDIKNMVRKPAFDVIVSDCALSPLLSALKYWCFE